MHNLENITVLKPSCNHQSESIFKIKLKKDLRKYRSAIKSHYWNFDTLYDLLSEEVVKHNRELGSYYQLLWGPRRIDKWVSYKFGDDRNVKIRIVNVPTFPKGDNTPRYYSIYLVSIPWFRQEDLPLIWQRCMYAQRKFFGYPSPVGRKSDSENYTIFVNGLQKEFIRKKDARRVCHRINIRTSSARENVDVVRDRILKIIRRFLYSRIKGFYKKIKGKWFFGELKHYVGCLFDLVKVFKTMRHGLQWKIKKFRQNQKKEENMASYHSSYRRSLASDNTRSKKKIGKRRLRAVFDYHFYPG